MKITRRNFADSFTGGKLYSDHFDTPLYTLEQEWRPDKNHAGGENDNSCVPNGTYQLIAFKRPRNGLIVPQLVNEDIGVFEFEANLPPEGGRFLILMHPGNTVKDIVGCIASGMWKEHENSVNDSRDAQMHLIQAFREGDTELTIESFNTTETYYEIPL